MISESQSKTGEQELRNPVIKEWELRLYVAGQTPKSVTALANLKKICDEHLEGKYRIEVIDDIFLLALIQNRYQSSQVAPFFPANEFQPENSRLHRLL